MHRSNRCARVCDLLDHLVGECDQGIRKVQPERLRCLEIDDKLKLSRLLHGNVGWLGALEDFANVEGGSPEQVIKVWPIRHERPFLRPASQLMDGWQPGHQ